MNEIFDLMRQKERKALLVLLLLLAAALLFYIFIARDLKGSYTQAEEGLASKREAFQRLDAERKDQKLEWRQWQQASKDIDKLRNRYFYSPDAIAQDMRRDIARIFQGADIPVPDIRYSYTEHGDQKIASGIATFQISGPYVQIKRFIFRVEKFPKFLILEKIDFVDISQAAGVLKLKITLAGYYEN
jgi:cell division protein FtsB